MAPLPNSPNPKGKRENPNLFGFSVPVHFLFFPFFSPPGEFPRFSAIRGKESAVALSPRQAASPGRVARGLNAPGQVFPTKPHFGKKQSPVGPSILDAISRFHAAGVIHYGHSVVRHLWNIHYGISTFTVYHILPFYHPPLALLYTLL